MGSRGPLASPNTLKLRGSFRKRSKKSAPTMQSQSGLPTCPSWLSAEAKAEWKRIVKACPPGMLTNLDRAGLAMLAESWATWKAVTEHLQSAGHVDGDGTLNPLNRVQRSAFERWSKLAGQFGLTPSARLRLNVGGDDGGKDEFDAFLSRRTPTRPRPDSA